LQRTLARVDVHVSLEGRGTLTAEIYRQLLAAIRDGRLGAGDRLPPTRELARQLSVARMTVSLAYERLTGEGFVISRVGAGTFVSEHAPSVGPRVRRPEGALAARRVWDGIDVNAVRNVFASAASYDFRPGIPDVSTFPFEAWRRLTARAWRPSAEPLGVYGDPSGHVGLRRAIARHIEVSRGVSAVAEDIIVTSGTQQALDILARALLAPGDEVAVEDPGYPPAWLLFRTLGAHVTPVPVDREGLIVEDLPRGARLVYVTPSHHFPLGTAMSLVRRLALLEWAQRHNAAIIEDDYDCEFRFGGRPMEPLQTMDSNGRVVYVGSFSKTLLPTLRLGFIVSPPSISEALGAVKFATDWHSPLTPQVVLAEFIERGGFARHIRKMRGIYQARHRQIVDTLKRDFAEDLEVVPSAVGLHVCAIARRASPTQIDALVERAAGLGVAVHALSDYAVVGRPYAGLVIGYGAIDRDRIDEGLRQLRRCFQTGLV
jgi:GntR family transcriptional regulator / MocR family aminotransferase